ncbi:M6 family metalloprotease domain-containing protein [Nonomuraea sp. NPDC049152]|uniref:M6 family metalloprotease domain-containing protein n=1 Tax=Nonomuraea sp. NPDC049152 TaxID=3154350 RepID=UPI00340DF74E
MNRLLALMVVMLALVAVPTPAHADGPAGCALPGRTGWTDEGHDTDPVQFLRATGRIRAVMLFVDFPDAPASESTQEYYDALAPAGPYLSKVSNGRARLTVTPVRRWLRMPQDSTTYGFDRGITYEQHQRYVGQAVAAADAEVDFSRYDIVYIVPNRQASAITFSPTYLWDPADPGVVADGAPVRWGVTFGQDMWRWGYKVLAHETGHAFGLPDLYAFSGPDYHRFVGGWDVMGLIGGPSPEPFAWHAWKLGWISDAQVSCATRGVHRLTPVEERGGRKLVVVRTGETTAYAVEYRKGSSCSGGVVIYKVDSSTATGEGPVRVMDARPGVPSAGCHALDDAAYPDGGRFTADGVSITVRGQSVEVHKQLNM